jgi:hypothetical protein
MNLSPPSSGSQDSCHPDEGDTFLRIVRSYSAAQHNISEDGILHSQCRENLKYYTAMDFIQILEFQWVATKKMEYMHSYGQIGKAPTELHRVQPQNTVV